MVGRPWRPRYYILDAENHVLEVDVMTWARSLEDDSRRVGYTEITSEVTVITTFLGLDHRHFGDGPPILFETMIFGGPLDEYQWRYASHDDALTGHQAAVSKARAATGQRIS